MKFKWVGRLDARLKMLRLFRVMWTRGKVGMPGGGYSAKFSVALRPSLLSFHREFDEWLLTILGVRLHFQKSHGGLHC